MDKFVKVVERIITVSIDRDKPVDGLTDDIEENLIPDQQQETFVTMLTPEIDIVPAPIQQLEKANPTKSGRRVRFPDCYQAGIQ